MNERKNKWHLDNYEVMACVAAHCLVGGRHYATKLEAMRDLERGLNQEIGGSFGSGPLSKRTREGEGNE